MAETRREKAQTYILAHPLTQWVVHPMGTNEPEYALSPANVLHALPYCDGGEVPVPPPLNFLMYVNTDILNVRTAPNTGNEPVAQLKRDDQVLVDAGDPWAKIVGGTYEGRYVYRPLLRPS